MLRFMEGYDQCKCSSTGSALKSHLKGRIIHPQEFASPNVKYFFAMSGKVTLSASTPFRCLVRVVKQPTVGCIEFVTFTISTWLQLHGDEVDYPVHYPLLGGGFRLCRNPTILAEIPDYTLHGSGKEISLREIRWSRRRGT